MIDHTDDATIAAAARADSGTIGERLALLLEERLPAVRARLATLLDRVEVAALLPRASVLDRTRALVARNGPAGAAALGNLEDHVLALERFAMQLAHRRP